MLSRLIRAAVLVAAFLAAASSNAVSVSPVKLELMPGQRATQLTIQNPTESNRTYDIRVQRWDGVDQASGRSITSQFDGAPILLSLPVVTLKPRARATIRVAVAERSPAPADYYRILVDDITPAETNTPATAETGSLANLRLSVSLPLEVRNQKGLAGQLVSMPDGDGITNQGTNIVAVLGAKKPDGKLDSSVSRYVFPGEKWVTTLRPDDLSWLAGIQ